MLDYLRNLFASTFMPHGHCYMWNAGLVWTHVVSDALIGLSYIAITATLIHLVRRVKDLPFQWIYVAFALFIVACGLTHLMEVWNVWHSHYWLAGAVKVVTAAASVGTALVLPPLVPKGVALAHASEVAHERGVKLEAAHGELAILYEKTKDLERLKTQFFANVSHELRTPLALILGPVEKWSAAPTLAPELRRDLELAGRNARMLLKHVNDLLDVSKLEAGKMQASYSETDLARIVHVTAAHFDGIARERGMTYTVEAPDALPAQLDPAKIERILLNLLSNAFKFTPEGGRVAVSLVRRGERAVLAVSDTGPGVPDEFRPVLFERFRQADAGTTRRHGGTGLGLAIVKDFAALHGGTVALVDPSGGGASFVVELPLAAPPGTAVQAAPAPGVSDEAARAALEELRTRIVAAVPPEGGEKPLVLVVEDNPDMGRFLVESLAPEYRCERALDGEEGLRKALALRPDLVLSDVMMPRASGDQMVREMRKVTDLDAVPVIMLTAKADDELRTRLLREGAQDYLVKPFSVEELRARVSNLVTMKRAREVLQRELASQLHDLEKLAGEVTSRKRELQSALETLRVARDHAERASQLKSNFLNLVSHELKTPLSALVLQLQSLERSSGEALPPRQMKAVKRMQASTARLTGLIESLLEYARIEAGRLPRKVEQVDLAALAREVVEELRPQAEQKHLALRLSVAHDLPRLETDPRLLRVVIANLVANAIKFTEKGSVGVDVARVEASSVVRVEDTGPGIPEEKQVSVFEPFEQLEPLSAKATPGVGLGLAIVKDLVQALDGAVSLRSQVGVGTVFTVTLHSR